MDRLGDTCYRKFPLQPLTASKVWEPLKEVVARLKTRERG